MQPQPHSAMMPPILKYQRVVLYYQGAVHFGTIQWLCPYNLLSIVRIDTIPAGVDDVMKRFDNSHTPLDENVCKATSEQDWERGVNERWHLRDIQHHEEFGWALMC